METITTAAEIQVSYRPAISSKPVIKSALDAFIELRPFYPDATIHLQEQFIVAYLNKANRLLGIYKASAGGISGTVADPRLILAVALKICASALILSHNHPSSNLQPSRADIELTRKIKEGAHLLDMKVFDHLVISPDNQYYSFANEGIL
jgi:DNA repair protein RadC